MFSFFKRSGQQAHVATINNKAIQVEPKETLLGAALRENIDFPHSCRVGGCAQCKCKLIDGKVKELTDIGYILSDEELDQGYILACQSVPQTDITIEVDLAARSALKKTSGRILEQTKLTHDITQLRVQLADHVQFKPGQFANISLESMPELFRSYSFASPCQPSGEVEFFVREVPGGRFSGAVNQQNLVGSQISLEGPLGEFWLRPGNAPIVMIAGGSGLAPIMSMLRHALTENDVYRDITLLFGARTQDDLYMLAEINEIQSAWKGRFTFIPVLSEESDLSSWTGERGLVTEFISPLMSEGYEAYLCGPPVMIDKAEKVLEGFGMTSDQIYADRFTTLAPTTNAA